VRFAEELIAPASNEPARAARSFSGRLGVLEPQADREAEQAGWLYSISVRLQFWVPAAIKQIPEQAWQPLADYSQDGEAQIAEIAAHGRRLIVRRTRLVGPQAKLWPDWRYFPFITNRPEALEIVEAEHRQHAVVSSSRSATSKTRRSRTFPPASSTQTAPGQLSPASRTTCCALDQRDRALSGETVRVARTTRRRLLQIPGRLTRTGRQWTLHLPARWPWQHDFTSALARIRGLPELT
jgi:hypothetical protein